MNSKDRNADSCLAVLIDGDNVPSAYVKEMLEEVAKYGNPTIKRIYGDFTKPHLKKWKAMLLTNAITPVQQYAYTRGKNATDAAMIIDAMDILYSGKVDSFCLVSSDSDFTRLATRLREAGKLVIGLGERKTPEPFIVACDRFIYVEILKKQKESEEEPNDASDDANKDKPKTNKTPAVEPINAKLVRLIKQTISDVADDDGWAFLGDVGSLLQKRKPTFDARNYGFEKLTPLMRKINGIEIEPRETGKRRSKLIYVRAK
ncbi:MAG: NYN domain-containing protein [Aureispira sp.]